VLILVEGSDRTGKSTLTRAVRDRIKELHPSRRVELLHAGPPTKHPLDEYERPLFEYKPGIERDVVCDRWHIGERVYPLVFQRSTKLTYPVLAHIEAFLRSRGALLVHTYASEAVIKSRLEAEQRERPGHSLVDQSQLCAASRLFGVETSNSELPLLRVNTTTNSSLEVVVDQIIDRARYLESTVTGIANLRTYVGPPAPRLLLVGDVRHRYRTACSDSEVAAQAAADSSPALMPYPATSGHFLLQAVDPLAVRGDYGIINVNDVDDAREAWKALGNPTAVALGRKAWKSASDWIYGVVPHPQYVKRFHHKHVIWYGTLIDRAAREGGDLLRERPSNTWLNGK